MKINTVYNKVCRHNKAARLLGFLGDWFELFNAG